MLALAPRPPPVLRRSPGRSLHPWPPGAVRALHPTPRTSGPRARPRPREYAPPRVRTPLRPTRPASNPSEPLRTSLPSSPLQDRGSASVAPLRTTTHARRGGPERACPAFSPSSCPSELQERLQLFKSAAIFTAANFPACLALRERELGPTGYGGRGRRDGWDLWGRHWEDFLCSRRPIQTCQGSFNATEHVRTLQNKTSNFNQSPRSNSSLTMRSGRIGLPQSTLQIGVSRSRP